MPKVPIAHLEARREAILAAACRVFGEKGFKAATMADVAAEADISAGAIYRYFANKEDLARHCLDETSGVLKERWTREPAAANPLEDFSDLARLTFSLVEGPAERLATILILERTLGAIRANDQAALREMREEHQAVREGIRQRIVACQAAGQLPGSLDAALLASALMAFYQGACTGRLVEPELDLQGQLAQILHLFDLAGRAAR